MIKIVGALSISLCFQVQARDYLCFLHGAQGDSEYMLEGVAPKLRNAGVPFISFQMNVKDEVQQ